MLECQRKETKETEKGLHFKRNDMILIDSLGGGIKDVFIIPGITLETMIVHSIKVFIISKMKE